MSQTNALGRIVSILGPGLLVAATGVGAGDLATAAFTGLNVGTVVLWSILVGAAIKFILNDELARYQVKTGDTLLEGMLDKSAGIFRWLWLVYFVLWSYMVAVALMSACGVVLYAIYPAGLTPAQGKILYGILHSIVGYILIRRGGYQLFEKIMKISIAGMFIAILFTASKLPIPPKDILSGLTIPRLPKDPQKLAWTLALMGGVGGTVTVLNYGYWLRESRRDHASLQQYNTFDIAISYGITAVFSIAMVLIGSQIQVAGKGATLIIRIADELDSMFTSYIKWIFLIGAWATVFSSLLGVWQGVPYLFADMWKKIALRQSPAHKPTSTYWPYLTGLAFIPITGLWLGFARMQQWYSLIGALFMPILSIALLVLYATDKRLRPLTSYSYVVMVLLVIILIFFAWIATY